MNVLIRQLICFGKESKLHDSTENQKGGSLMKTRKLTALILSILMIISVFPSNTLAAPSAVTVSDSSSENPVADSTAELAEEYCISLLNKPGTTFVLSHNEYTYDVCDLWKEVDSDGTGELKFDQSFSININDAVEVYNNFIDTQYPDGDREHYKALEDNNNGAIFYVQARVLINDYEYQFSSRASYMYAPYGLDGEYNEGCGEWNISSYYNDLSDFLTISRDGGILNLSLDGTVKEIYEALKAQDEALGNVTINNLEFELRVSCEVEYRGSWGSINYTELGFDGVYHTLYDKHIYGSTSEYDTLSVIPITAPITVNVGPMYEGCYEPVKTEYSWYYEFIKEGEEEAEDGAYKWYGYFEKDESKESDVLTETAPSGTIYGIAYGKVDSDSNSITLDDILNEDNKDFIGSFIGEKPRELGGKGQMFIGCDVTLTFEDGKQWVVYITKADYMSRLITPCIHACTVCGLCTVTDEMLPCNFDQMNYDITNICMCEEPSVPEYEITVESENTVTVESTERTVNVVVEKIKLEETPTNSFIINATDAVGLDNVVALYNVNLFDEEGHPCTLNPWYDEGEELTVTFNVGEDVAAAVSEGKIKVYHVSASGDTEEVTGITVNGSTISFVWSDFSPFVIAYVPESIELELGEKGADTNVRYIEIDGIQTEITEDNDNYTVEIGNENTLVEVVEKTQGGEFVKSQYFYIDAQTKTAEKLSMDSYMQSYDETSIRTTNPMGIRFKSSVLTSAKDEETEYVIDEYGFIVAREDELDGKELTFDFSKYITGVAYNKADRKNIIFDAASDEHHIFAGYVKNIPVKNYKTNIVCKTYTKITVNGEQFVLYGEPVTGNVYDTAKSILEDNTLHAITKATLEKIISDYDTAVALQ